MKLQPKQKKAKSLKTITVDECVAKYGKYGLYDNNADLTSRSCGQRKDDLITTHITRDGHDRKCTSQISMGAPFFLWKQGTRNEKKLVSTR